MINSVGNSNASLLIAAAMKEVSTAQEIEIAVLKKGQDVDKANGESALKLIASATGVTNEGGGIDIHV
jgi:hypothetical protein